MPKKFKLKIPKLKKKLLILLLKFFIILLLIYYIFNNFEIFYIKNVLYKIRNKKIKVCLCIFGKEENLYAKEYVNHYKKLGYNHIFLYDNNDINGEKFEDVLQTEINSGFVTIIDFKGKRTIKNKLKSPQLDVFYDCYEKNNKNYDWLSFFDFDEFLELYPNNLKIQDFLGNKRYDKCQNIKINFLFYSDNELLYYDNRSIEERFTTPLPNAYDNMIIKSTVRGGLKENYWKKSTNTHTSLMNYTCCNSLGQIMDYRANNYKKFNFSYAALKHYYTKTVEEYVHKTKRGEGHLIYTPFNNKRKYHKINNYFYYNKRTTEKLKLFKKLFNIT